jgi:predicted lysophospholipase L1 biosynthesis ABC-type transport system permease subunit
MGFTDQIYHWLNFLAPAAVVAVVLASVGTLLMKKSAIALGFIGQVAINMIAGSMVLGLGLWFFGRDGKMASYAALLVVTSTSQWLVGRGWR